MRLLKARLSEDTKGFYCDNCLDLYRRAKAPPACWSNACPVQDIAPDKELNLLADAFLKFEALDSSPGARSFQEKLLRDTGLAEESADTILEMKRIFGEYRRKQLESATAASSRRR